VPDIGEGIAEVELVEWHVKPGDTVIADQILADVMTDKATVEVPAPIAGVVAAITGNPGDKLAVGSELLRIDGDGGGEAVAQPEPATPQPAPGAPKHVARDVGDYALSQPTPRTTPELEVETAAGSQHTDAASTLQKAAQPAPRAAAGATPAAASTQPLASPSVRQHARQLSVELAEVHGSGPGGRVLHEDVERHAARASASPATSRQGSPAAQRYAPREGETIVPVIGLRRQIAQHMQAALAIPHFTYVEEVDVTELETLREKLNQRHAEARGKLTVLPFIMRAIALAAPDFPQMNARYDADKGVVTRYAAVNLGIATQTNAGLMVPVVRHAEARDLWDSAAEVARLAAAARANKITRDDLSGSTITLTSLGPLGGIVTTPVINAPEVAIIGVNRIVERPTMMRGAVVGRRMMNLSSSFDHRVIDGQNAAEFVQALRGYLECPGLLFVE
jgi:2-oxoisovalerate dehydrogenase E2 component (dihydrolipoyl transacylase)